MALYTPFMEKVGKTLGASMARTGRSELAGNAYMGDPGAMQELMRVDPDLGIQIQERKRASQQRQVTAQAQGDNANAKMEQQKRKIYTENRELMDGIFKQAAKIDNYDEARAFVQRKFDENSEILGEYADASGFTPETYSQVKTIFGDNVSFKQQEIDIKRETLEMRKLENEARRDDNKLDIETNQLKRDELKLKIKDRENLIDQRKEKIEDKKNQIAVKAQDKISAVDETITSVTEFVNNKDFMNLVSGYTGRFPTISTGGIDAEASFENIKNNLTLENLGKMSGVLSETDIKILSTAASKLTLGMSEKAMKKEFTRIKAFLNGRKGKFKKEAERAGVDFNFKPKTVIEQAKDINIQAMEWAKANPSDPRAAKIMQKLGAQ